MVRAARASAGNSRPARISPLGVTMVRGGIPNLGPLATISIRRWLNAGRNEMDSAIARRPLTRIIANFAGRWPASARCRLAREIYGAMATFAPKVRARIAKTFAATNQAIALQGQRHILPYNDEIAQHFHLHHDPARLAARRASSGAPGTGTTCHASAA